ncbi:MAG: hypothetical protein NC833_02765 [Candidatus Omnitrophica bacterium]|nr:hypothetical protein [Candidatus Omnitrophota bacterium]
MKRIIEFYKGLNQKRKVIFWVAVGIICLSILRVSIWSAKRNKTPTAKKYIKHIKSQDENEKIYGIYTVGNLKIKEILPEIEEIFQKDQNEQVKRVCAWSIGQIDFNKLLTYLDSSDKKIKDITFETILKIDKKNVDYLIERFDKEDIETKLKILSYMKSPEYQDKLMKIIENENEDINVRKSALEIVKNVCKWEEIETSLWALYYNEKNDEMKNYVYQVINEMRKRGQK